MEYTSLVDTSLDLNTNPTHFLSLVPKQEAQTNFIELGLKMSSVNDEHEAGALMEELKRVNAENKKLTEMLTVLCEKYNALHKHLDDYKNKNIIPARSNSIENPKKRKPESPVNQIIINERGVSESSSSDEDCCKKPRQEQHTKNKTSRVCFRTEASDTGLVSPLDSICTSNTVPCKLSAPFQLFLADSSMKEEKGPCFMVLSSFISYF